MNLFVYGTLKDNELFKVITGHKSTYKPAILYGYTQTSQLKIKKTLNSDSVSGFLIKNITEEDLRAIDHYESLNRLYSRKKVQIKTAERENVDSWVYVPLNP